MSNTNTNMATQLYLDAVLKGFTDYFVPLNIFSLDASPSPVQRGQTVRVPFIISGSTAQDFSGTYSAQASTRQGLDVTINKHKFVYAATTDTELADSAIASLEQVGHNQGESLAAAVLTDIFTVFTGSNFSNGQTLASSSLVTVDSLVDVRAAVSALKWPEAGRNVIMKSTPFKFLLKDDDLKYIYRGDAQAITSAQIKNVFGWNGIYENNLLPTSDSGATLAHVAVNRDAVIIANRYLAPQSGHAYSAAQALTHKPSGLVLGVRKWYDNDTGELRNIIECNYGYRVGNPAAAYLTRVTVNA